MSGEVLHTGGPGNQWKSHMGMGQNHGSAVNTPCWPLKKFLNGMVILLKVVPNDTGKATCPAGAVRASRDLSQLSQCRQ